MKMVIFNKGHDQHYFHGFEDGDILFIYNDGYPRAEGEAGLDSVINVPDLPPDTVEQLTKTSEKAVTTFRGKTRQATTPDIQIRFDLLPQHAQDKILIARKGEIPFGLLKNAMFNKNGKKWDED